MAKKPPASSESPSLPASYEPTKEEINVVIRASLGGIRAELARLILIQRHQEQGTKN